MKAKLKKLGALISMSLAHGNSADADTNDIKPIPVDNDTFAPSKLNLQISDVLAAHRSHSSHSSHRSHRSSSSGGYSSPSTPPTPKPKPVPKSDPLGQDSRPGSSYPSTAAPQSLSQQLSDKEKRKNIIMRMQLALKFDGYYSGPIDGVMGPTTREAVRAYKKAKSIPGDSVIDVETLNALGIQGF